MYIASKFWKLGVTEIREKAAVAPGNSDRNIQKKFRKKFRKTNHS